MLGTAKSSANFKHSATKKRGLRFWHNAKERRLGATQIRNRHKSHHCWKSMSVVQYFTEGSVYKYISQHTQAVIPPSVYCDTTHVQEMEGRGVKIQGNNAFDFATFPVRHSTEAKVLFANQC
jgi:hypothetical protein